jgi:hypothetical protein
MQKGRKNQKKPEPPATPNKKAIIKLCKDTEDVYELLELTHHEDNDIRLAATT